jgi:hypothetical protein
MLLDHPSSSASDHTPSLAQNPLLPCVYIALRCPHCGELRQALASAPSSENVACPVCNATCNFLLLGRGLTTSQLPFHELYPRELTRWITHDPTNDDPNDGEIDALNPETRSEDARNPVAHSKDARNAEAGDVEALDGS